MREQRKVRLSQMRNILAIGQEWLRRRDQKPFHVVQIHRGERSAELRADDGEYEVVPFFVLVRDWEWVQ